MVKLLERLDYHVGNRAGNTKQFSNMIDFILTTGYFAVSIANVGGGKISFLTLVVNIILAFRLGVRKIAHQKDVNKEADTGEFIKSNWTFVSIYKIVTCFFGAILIAIVGLIAYHVGSNLLLNWVAYFGLALNYTDDIISLIERLYSAEPRSLYYLKEE